MSKKIISVLFLSLMIFSFKEASPIPNTQYPIDEILSSSIKYEHPRDSENFKNGFSDGSLDAKEGVLSLCAAKKCRAQNPYERGYQLGYKKEARQKQSQNKSHFIDPLIDSPGKTMGSDFNGDGIHDVIMGAYLSEVGGGFNRGAVYVFFGSTTISGQKAGSTADVTINGKVDEDRMGRTVSSAGDINGDGIDDMIMGTQYNDEGPGNDAGAAYIFFGATTLSGTKNLGTIASADVTILGKAAGDQMGISVSGAGDVNGDGFDDVIVGAHGNDDGGGANNAGAAYILFGAGNLSGTKSLGEGQSADVTFLGKAATDILGFSVSGAGDVNGDGFDDIIVGAYGREILGTNDGEAYIFFGSSSLSGTKNLDTTASPDVTIQGEGHQQRLGFSVSGAGDINGDGFDDVTLFADRSAGDQIPGKAYIFYGSSSISGTKGGAAANVIFLGKSNADRLGMSISGAGDINDDGFDDVIIGSRYDDSGGPADRGAAYVFFGASDLSGTKNLATTASADVTILGQAGSDQLGRGVSSIGDVNADGIPDIIVGANKNDFAGTDNGATYVIFGSTTLSGTKDLLGTFTPDVTMTGGGAGDNLGLSVGGGRDSSGQ